MVGWPEQPGRCPLEREPGLADPSGWWRLSVAEKSFLAAKHPQARLAAAAELVHYRQTGRFMRATDDLPPGVVEQLVDATATQANDLAGWLWSAGPHGGTARQSSIFWVCGV